MIGTKPIVQRHSAFPVVTLEETVMQLMETITSRYPLLPLKNQPLEAYMPQCWREGVVLGVHQHVNGMRGHDPVNQDTAEDNQVLNRMHGDARPRPDIDVFVMEVVNSPIERRPVQETMYPVEVKNTNNGHED